MNYILAVLSGILLGIPFVYPSFALLSWFGLIPFLFAIEGSNNKKAFLLGWIMGCFFFALNGYWLLYPLINFSGFPLLVNIFIFLLAVMILALFVALFSFLFKATIKGSNFSVLLIVPIIWTGIEFVRTLLPIGYYFGFLGYSQSFIPQLIQLAHYGGVYIVSFLIVLFNTLLYLAIKKDKLRYSLLGILIFATIFTYGQWQTNRDFEIIKEFDLAVVQPNIPQRIKMSPQHQAEVREKLINLSQKEIKENEPDLLIWPETAILKTYNEQRAFPYLSNDETPLFIGGFLNDGAGPLNSSMLVDSENNIVQTYSKVNLVPFGEYTPFSNLMPQFLGGFMNNLTPGEKLSSFELQNLTWSSPICSEILNPFYVRRLQKNNDFIITIANEAWFSDSNLPLQMIQATIFRAVENRKQVVKSGNTGISGLISENGEVIKSTKPFVEENFTLSLQIKEDNRGLYKTVGDSFAFLIVSVMSALVLFALIKSR